MRLNQPFTFYYFIVADNVRVGVIRVIDKKADGEIKKISPLFIMPEYRNRGYAQAAIKMAEQLHGEKDWELDTILQEACNCHLYEKMGYRKTGKIKTVNQTMSLVYYQK